MNLKEINQRIGDRLDCFYWQTDRKKGEKHLEELSEIFNLKDSDIKRK